MRDSSINCNNIIIVQIYKALFNVNNLVDINRLFTTFVDNPWFSSNHSFVHVLVSLIHIHINYHNSMLTKGGGAYSQINVYIPSKQQISKKLNNAEHKHFKEYAPFLISTPLSD